jgi:hypothetical protein
MFIRFCCVLTVGWWMLVNTAVDFGFYKKKQGMFYSLSKSSEFLHSFKPPETIKRSKSLFVSRRTATTFVTSQFVIRVILPFGGAGPAWSSWRLGDHIQPKTTCNQAYEIICY